MKTTISKALPVIMICITLSVTGQINSGVGYMHGTNKKGDTTSKSEYDADKAPVVDKADTTVISRRPTRASEARQERLEQQANDQDRSGDDTTATTAANDNEGSSTTETYIHTSYADCVSPAWRYAAVGFGLLSLLLILLLVIGRRKDEPRRL